MNYSRSILRFQIESLLFRVFIPLFYSEQLNYFNLKEIVNIDIYLVPQFMCFL